MSNKRQAFTLVELLVVIAIIGVLVALLLPAIQSAREAARRTQCADNSHNIGLAIHSFHDAKKFLPSSTRPPTAPTIRAGSFIFLLPFVERQDLWDLYDLTKQWGNPINVTNVTSKRITIFECPSSPTSRTLLDHDPSLGTSPFAGIVANGDYAASLGVAPGVSAIAASAFPNYYGTGVPLRVEESAAFTSTAAAPTNGFLPKNAKIGFGDIIDGLSNTIAIFESGGRPLVYRRGVSLGTDPAAHRVNAGGWCRAASDILFEGSNATGSSVPGVFFNRTNGVDVGGQSYGGSGYPAPYGTEGTSQPFAFHKGGQNVILGDASVRFLDEGIDFGVLCALISRNGAGGIDNDADGNITPAEYKEPVIDQGKI